MFRKPELRPTAASAAAALRGDYENALIAATPGGIQAQEKRGQQELVASSHMPKIMRPDQAAFEKVGFVFEGAYDDIFLNAQLPAGWTRAATEHDMHSEILDEKGRRRVSVFYKAAFYDRRADCHLLQRYYLAANYERGEGRVETYQIAVTDRDGEKILWQSEKIAHPESSPYQEENREAWQEYSRKQDEADAQAKAWMEENYPDYADPTSYW